MGYIIHLPEDPSIDEKIVASIYSGIAEFVERSQELKKLERKTLSQKF